MLQSLEVMEAVTRVLLSSSFFNIASSISGIIKKVLTEFLTKKKFNTKYLFYIESLVTILVFGIFVIIFLLLLKKIMSSTTALRAVISDKKNV